MAAKKSTTKSKPIVLRAYSGVFFGFEIARRSVADGYEVDVRDIQHIHDWQAAGIPEGVHCCEEIALRGVGTDSRVSRPLPGVSTLARVYVILPATPAAVARIEASPWRP